jgi:hypothetical protein
LDCEPNADSVEGLVEDQSSKLTDYLNFFELLAILHKSKQMSASAIEDMFGYYLDCIQRHGPLNVVRDKQQPKWIRAARALFADS